MITLCILSLLPFAGGSPEGGGPLWPRRRRGRDFWGQFGLFVSREHVEHG